MMKDRAPSPIEAVGEVVSFLGSKDIPYVIIGGLAVQHWGEPRATRDVDITVMVPDKCVAGRPRDLEDVRGILQRQQERVDIPYIRRWLKEFAALLPEHDVAGRFEAALSSALEG